MEHEAWNKIVKVEGEREDGSWMMEVGRMWTQDTIHATSSITWLEYVRFGSIYFYSNYLQAQTQSVAVSVDDVADRMKRVAWITVLFHR
jgi:hypothetical protein